MFTDEEIEKAKRQRSDEERQEKIRKSEIEARKNETEAIIAKYLHGLVDAMPNTAIPYQRYKVSVLQETRCFFKKPTASRCNVDIFGWCIMKYDIGWNEHLIYLDKEGKFYDSDGDGAMTADEVARKRRGYFLNQNTEQIHSAFLKVLSGGVLNLDLISNYTN